MFHSQVKLFPLFFCQTSAFVWQNFRGGGGGGGLFAKHECVHLAVVRHISRNWGPAVIALRAQVHLVHVIVRLHRDCDFIHLQPCSLTLSLPGLQGTPSPWKQPIKVPNLKPLRLFCPLHISTRKNFYSTIGLSDILFGGVYVCINQPRSFTGWGSEGVKNNCVGIICHCTACSHLGRSSARLVLVMSKIWGASLVGKD